MSQEGQEMEWNIDFEPHRTAQCDRFVRDGKFGTLSQFRTTLAAGAFELRSGGRYKLSRAVGPCVIEAFWKDLSLALTGQPRPSTQLIAAAASGEEG